MFIQPSLQKTLIANTLFCKYRYVLENGSIAVYFGSFVHSECASTDLFSYFWDFLDRWGPHTRFLNDDKRAFFHFFNYSEKSVYLFNYLPSCLSENSSMYSVFKFFFLTLFGFRKTAENSTTVRWNNQPRFRTSWLGTNFWRTSNSDLLSR